MCVIFRAISRRTDFHQNLLHHNAGILLEKNPLRVIAS